MYPLSTVLTNALLQYFVGYVAYGPAETYPDPIVAKRFFAPMNIEFAKVFVEGVQIGVGKTSSGGSSGLAALDGLVAGVEVRSLSDLRCTSW